MHSQPWPLLQRLASHHGTHPRRRCDAAPCALKALTPTTPLTTSVCTSTRAQRTTLGERTCARVLPHPCTQLVHHPLFTSLHHRPNDSAACVHSVVSLLCTIASLHLQGSQVWRVSLRIASFSRRGASLTLCSHTGANRCTQAHKRRTTSNGLLATGQNYAHVPATHLTLIPCAARRYTDLPPFDLRVFINDTFWDRDGAGPIFLCELEQQPPLKMLHAFHPCTSLRAW